MQASIPGKGIVNQDYRQVIGQALKARWPDIEIVDPFILHPNSVEYGDDEARETLLAMADLAGRCDLVIAYVPTASMGTALEMYSAYRAGVPVVTISPLSENWVVKTLSRRVYGDLDAFLAQVRHAVAPMALCE